MEGEGRARTGLGFLSRFLPNIWNKLVLLHYQSADSQARWRLTPYIRDEEGDTVLAVVVLMPQTRMFYETGPGRVIPSSLTYKLVPPIK